MQNTQNIEPIRLQLASLAEYLEHERENILDDWRQATEGISGSTTAASLTRVQFNDHVPMFLDVLACRLRSWPEPEDEASGREAKEQELEHGVQRWQQGYQLPEMIGEWGHLQTKLMDIYSDYALAHAELDVQVMLVAHKMLWRLSIKGIDTATGQYWRLHQAEAASHVQDLEQALATLNQLEQVRADTWREAAHDLRGSMSLVQASSNLLEDKGMPDTERQEFYEIMQNGMRSLQLILSDLMFLARLDAGKEQREIGHFDAARTLREFCQNSQSLAHERGLYLTFEGPASLLVQGDRAKILRIFQNLILNSLKYTQQGGISVIWSADQAFEANHWIFSIKDTGPGLTHASPLLQEMLKMTQGKASEIAEHQPFPEPAPEVLDLKIKPSASLQASEGVGLSIVKRLCEVLDANLELESSSAKGSLFKVTLPRSYAEN